MKRTYDAEFFDGKCPYTGKPCYEWECNTCEVEEQEKKNMEELDKAKSEEHDHMTVDELVELFTERGRKRNG